jgi:hypothetical protein
VLEKDSFSEHFLPTIDSNFATTHRFLKIGPRNNSLLFEHEPEHEHD